MLPARACAAEGVEPVALLLSRDSDSLVRDRQLHLFARSGQRHLDPIAGRRVLDGVAHEVVEDLFDPKGSADERR